MSQSSRPYADASTLLRFEDRLYRVVGETMVDGERMRVCAPVGRGPLRAIRCQPDDVTESGGAKSTDRATVEGGAEAKRNTGRAGGPHQRQARPRLTPAERFQAALLPARLHRALLPSPGRIGYLPIALLVAILTVLAAVLD